MKVTGWDTALDTTRGLQKRLEGFGGELEGTIDEGVREVAEEVRDRARKNVETNDEALRHSIRVGFSGSKRGSARYYVHTNHERARWTEYGTDPHPIIGGLNPPPFWLRFIGRKGDVVYAKRVNHPGQPPRPYMRPALEAVRPRAGDIVEQHLEELTKRYGLAARDNR